jgi:hypothetical protein
MQNPHRHSASDGIDVRQILLVGLFHEQKGYFSVFDLPSPITPQVIPPTPSPLFQEGNPIGKNSAILAGTSWCEKPRWQYMGTFTNNRAERVDDKIDLARGTFTKFL